MQQFLVNLLRRFADLAVRKRNEYLAEQCNHLYSLNENLAAQLRSEMVRSTRPPGAYVTWRDPTRVLAENEAKR